MKIVSILIVLLTTTLGFAQLQTHTFEDAEKLSAYNPKPFVIFIHTSWCQYCKLMENTTFKNETLVNQLNKNFYFIALDAEGQQPIRFSNQIFKFKPKGIGSGIHELAEALAEKEGVVSYPTLAILDTDYSVLIQIQSFMDANALSNLLLQLQQ